MIKGIDVSNWQGQIDFSKVKTSGYEIVYIKATEGEHTPDPSFETNYANAKANGLKIGVYHFLQGNESGVDQANFLYSKIQNKELDCRIAIDVEVTNGANPTQLSQIVCDFAERIKSLTGLEVVVYTYLGFANSNLTNQVAKYPLWIAEYGVSAPQPNKIWGTNYIGWQYADNGQVNGCPNGNTDLDYFTEEIFTTSSKTNVKVITQSTNSPYHVGEEVNVIGNTYSTGQEIPDWVKEGSYPIIQVDSGKVLLGNGLDSWVDNNGVVPIGSFHVGENVKVIGSTYATGQTIPSWVQGQVYPIIQVANGKVLLGGGLMSWIPNNGVVSASAISFKVGQNVRIIANNYSTGQTVPAWVKQNTYPITQVGQGKCLLGNGLDSWVDNNGLVLA